MYFVTELYHTIAYTKPDEDSMTELSVIQKEPNKSRQGKQSLYGQKT